ncbi:MAG: DJ-1/PfpI family protein [Balneolaceae bacterium]|nr:DJ-1/PfpI family protein [Balneolaceae bacterium]
MKRLDIYIFDVAEVIDFTGPAGVFAVAKRMDPELEVVMVGDTLSPVKTTANLTVTPRYALDHDPDLDAFLIPGGIGTRTEMHNGRLTAFIERLPKTTLLVSVCTGSWIYGNAGLLDGITATNRKHGDPNEKVVPIERLAEIAPGCTIDEHRIVDTGCIITAGGISSGLEMGFHLLKRFGKSDKFVDTVAYVMEYDRQWDLMKDDLPVETG